MKQPESPPLSPYQKYIEESKAPLSSLLFILPFLLAYHIGLWITNCFVNAHWVNGADRILANFLLKLGGIGPFVGIFCIIISLLIWQHASNYQWKISFQTLFFMAIESFVLAIPLFFFGTIVRYLFSIAATSDLPFITNIVLAFGAGIYEEFVFRMLAMSILFFIFGTIFQIEGWKLSLLVIVIQALLFAFFHYLPGSQEKIMIESKEFWHSFIFRFIGGIYFALIYKERGLGIATGTHAFYDIIAVTMNAFR
ncbi:MAG: CPBP family intramembrane metalloprotease [Planctomycetota bacterium]|nr:CPBP family intramembrane metalloprotease [Planctomycetota bacterium]